MRAARLVRPRRFELVDAAPPAPGPGELLVRVEGCGVCGSDLPPWRGADGVDLPLRPGAPGHEGWGRIVSAGSSGEGGAPGAGELAPGRRVAFLSETAYAESSVVARSRVVPLPPELEGSAVPLEPAACAVNVARRARVRPGDTVVVVGVGFLGALLLRLLRRDDPGRVVAVSRRRTSRAAAERTGADEVLGYDEARAWADRAEDGAADVVVEATGKQGPLDLAARLCRIRGRLVVAGYHQDGPRRVDMRLWNWRGLDVVNAHERDPAVYLEGMRGAVESLVSGGLELEPLITHRFPLDEIQRAFEVADARPEGFFKAVVLTGEGSP